MRQTSVTRLASAETTSRQVSIISLPTSKTQRKLHSSHCCVFSKSINKLLEDHLSYRNDAFNGLAIHSSKYLSNHLYISDAQIHPSKIPNMPHWKSDRIGNTPFTLHFLDNPDLFRYKYSYRNTTSIFSNI